MSLKIETNLSAVAHHIIDGPVTFPYAIDARSAISRFPAEWSATPWSAADVDAARREQGAPEVEMTDEERAASEDHEKAVAAANERLTKFRAEQEEKRKIAEQVAADEALVASPPPRPDPTIRRPFGRQGQPTPAELDQIKKREAKKAADDKAAAAKQADDERVAREKANVDKTGTT